MAPHVRVAGRARIAPWLAPLLLSIGLLGVACAPTLVARPRLVAAWPAPGEVLGRRPRQLELTFNRALAPTSSSVHLAATAGAQVPAVATAFDGGRVELQLDQPLAPGEYTVQWHAEGTRASAAADGEYAFFVSGERGPSPQVSVSQAETDAGQVIEVRGQGWAPGQDVQFKIGDDEVPFGGVQADRHGNFSADARVPRETPFGVQPVTAVDGQARRALAAVRVVWGGWPPLAAWTSGTPGPRPGEVTFSISLQNRSDYLLEGVRVDVPDPPGARVIGVDGGGQHVDGHLRWEIGVLDRGTAGPLRAVYATQGPIATHATIDFRHRRPHDCSGNECPSAFVSQTTSDAVPVAP